MITAFFSFSGYHDINNTHVDWYTVLQQKYNFIFCKISCDVWTKYMCVCVCVYSICNIAYNACIIQILQHCCWSYIYCIYSCSHKFMLQNLQNDNDVFFIEYCPEYAISHCYAISTRHNNYLDDQQLCLCFVIVVHEFPFWS